MTNYPNNNNHDNNNPSTSCCFSGFFRRFICTGNLPTHPSPLDNNNNNNNNNQTQLEKPTKFHSSLTNNFEENLNLVKSQVQTQANNSYSSPGIIAKLMGLETLPNNEKSSSTTLDSLFRSKSLNSLYFLPDFDPARTSFHRRARTSASFHEQGHKLLFKIDENLESDGVLFVQESKGSNTNECTRQKKKEGELKEKNRKICGKSRVKVGEGKKKSEECYTNCGGSSFNNRRSRNLKNKVNDGVKNAKVKEKLVDYKESKVISSRIVSKKKIVKNQVLCINNEEHGKDSKLISRSPVSVLDDRKEIYKVNRRHTSSSSRRKATTNIKIHDNLAPKSKKICDSIAREDEVVKTGRKVADNLVEILGHICMLAEEHTLRETNWVAHYNSFDVHFVQELSLQLGQQMLDLLLDELLHDITIML